MSQEKAGSIKRIRVENFMCHPSLSIDLADRVNFITGQNGSGKSAILTALCVAFGIKARGTQRATSLKDFIKNGQSYSSVIVDIKNEGGDAFKPDVYGKVITIERRITESSHSFTMKDERGKKVGHKREDLQELLDHFNIEVENPCVIMTQDKSREFLHAGSGKEKFSFFFKATLLQQVSDLLKSIRVSLTSANGVIDEIKEEMRPYSEEIKLLEDQIKSVQQIEQYKDEATAVKKKLAWSWVDNTRKELAQHEQALEIDRDKRSTCEQRLIAAVATVNKVKEAMLVKQTSIQEILATSGQLRNAQLALEKELAEATKERAGFEEDLEKKRREITRSKGQLRSLKQQVGEIILKHAQNTQAEAFEREQQFLAVKQAIESKKNELRSLTEEEKDLQVKTDSANQQVVNIKAEMDEIRANLNDLAGFLRRLSQQRINQMTTFGGDRVLELLKFIEQREREFSTPPIGPIGSHLTLVDAKWSLAIEVAIGKLLDAFIVASHRDMLLLRQIASRARYGNLRIIIYDFTLPPLRMRPDQLPDPSLVTVKDVLQTQNTVVMNTLIDQGSVERQVLAADYDEGKSIAFSRSHICQNVKEVLTKDGLKMFVRGGSETTLPKDRWAQGRLGVRIDEQENETNAQVQELKSKLRQTENRKRTAEDLGRTCDDELQAAKRRRINLQRAIVHDEFRLRELERTALAESALEPEPDVHELEDEVTNVENEIQRNEDITVKMQFRVDKAQERVNVVRARFDELRESAKGDIDASNVAEQELLSLEEELRDAIAVQQRYEKGMEETLLPRISKRESKVEELQIKLEADRGKALQVCPEQDVIDLGGLEGKSTEDLTRAYTLLQNRIRREEQQNEPLDELLEKRNKIERKFAKKELSYRNFLSKLDMLNTAFEKRCNKFERNCTFLRRQLTWQFNGHLRRKGFSGSVKVNYETETLALEVQMPQDASGSAVRDTRALSGGERSYSTLSFALALHDMTEAPFRAMDEFDVFMDAVSRKISLDTVVDFAVKQGSQWIFITPHDISSVIAGPFVRKQQMSAPRP